MQINTRYVHIFPMKREANCFSSANPKACQAHLRSLTWVPCSLGVIPKELGRLRGLRMLQISYNQLTGESNGGWLSRWRVIHKMDGLSILTTKLYVGLGLIRIPPGRRLEVLFPHNDANPNPNPIFSIWTQNDAVVSCASLCCPDRYWLPQRARFFQPLPSGNFIPSQIL